MSENVKNEIMRRFEILFEQGLYPDVENWVRDGKILVSEKMIDGNNGDSIGILFTLNEKPEYAPYVEEIESKKHVKVFMCIVTPSMYGTLLALMFVSAYESDWDDERNWMKNDQTHCAFVFNFEADICECEEIPYEIKGGGLVNKLVRY